MNIRTDQDTFGSYHPNDIKADITNYFNDNGERPHSDNQWGLVLYNPNAAMSQYMGQLQEPGNLVPGGQNAGETGKQPSEQVQAPTLGFNPDDVNKQLMKTLQKSGYSGQNAPAIKTGSVGIGFDPNAMNKELMASMFKHAEQSQKAPAGSQSTSSHIANQNANTGFGIKGSAYNADQVNAGLYSSMNYDPNSVNSASFNMGSFSGSGNSMPSNTGSSSSTGTTNSNGAPAAGTQSQNAAGSQSQNVAGAALSQNAAGGIKSPLQVGSQSQNTASGIKSPFQAGVGAGGFGGTGSFNPFSSSQTGSGITGGQNTGQSDESIVPVSSANQLGLSAPSVSQLGLPPGIPAGMELSQTEAEKPTVNGIGSLGV